VLPDLLEVGEAYCELDKPRLNELIEGLEPKVRQLAGVLSLSIDAGDYTQILLQAHEQMSRVAESVAAALSQGIATQSATPIESEPHELHALALARQLRASFEEFFTQPAENQETIRAAVAVNRSSASPARAPTDSHQPRPADSPDSRRQPLAEPNDLAIRLTLAVGRCRSTRKALGVALLGADALGQLAPSQRQHLQRLLQAVCTDLDVDCEAVAGPGAARRLIIISGRDRFQAVAVARSVVEQVRALITQMIRAELLPACTAAAGVAWVATPAKNFRPISLLETAERCLAAALISGGVKSLEVS
jgi:hypothetical protein